MDSSRMSESSRVSFEPTASDAEERSIGEDSMSNLFRFFLDLGTAKCSKRLRKNQLLHF